MVLYQPGTLKINGETITTRSNPFNVEVIKETFVDPHWNSVSLLLGIEDNQIKDLSSYNHTIQKFGNTAIVGSQKDGEPAIYFDGNGDYLYVNSSLLAMENGDYTWEAWVKNTYRDNYQNNARDQTIFGSLSGSNYILFYLANKDGYSAYWNGYQFLGSSAVALNTWTHIALSSTNGLARLFRNGLLESELQINFNHSNTNFYIGGHAGTNNRYFYGYIHSARITKGIARYTANFIPKNFYKNNLEIYKTLAWE